MGSELALNRMHLEEDNCGCGCSCASDSHPNELTIAIATVPCQNWGEPYDVAEALQVGTIFPELDKPFIMGGDVNVQ